MLNLLKLKIDTNLTKITTKKGDLVENTRYYPSSTKEWKNSVYLYNNSNIKLIPVVDKTIIHLIKSYFNFYNKKLEISIKNLKKVSGYLNTRIRRLSTNKIFISETNLKHTNNNVTITLYVFNKQINYFSNILNSINSFSRLNIINFKSRTNIVNNNNLNILAKIDDSVKEFNNNNDNNYFSLTKISRIYIKKVFKREILYLLYKQQVFINKSKFADIYLAPLKTMLSKIYDKKVIFNIVFLKNYYMNSDIFTEILKIKLSNRENTILNLLKRSFRTIKSPFYRRLNFLSEKKKLQNITQNFIINSLIYDFSFKDNLDKLNCLLYNKHIHNKDVKNIVIKSLKGKTVTGIRLEASGRLTKRITAARSTYQYKYIGSLKNIYSSYKRVSSVVLRGNTKNNLQLTKINYKTRIGSFGLKGWISGI